MTPGCGPAGALAASATECTEARGPGWVTAHLPARLQPMAEADRLDREELGEARSAPRAIRPTPDTEGGQRLDGKIIGPRPVKPGAPLCDHNPLNGL
jgi:hypothetical protein